jgi:hypothetical protein
MNWVLECTKEQKIKLSDRKESMQTGDQIKWTIDGKVRFGIFRQCLGNQAEVICTKFENVPMAVKTIVEKRLLSLI